MFTCAKILIQIIITATAKQTFTLYSTALTLLLTQKAVLLYQITPDEDTRWSIKTPSHELNTSSIIHALLMNVYLSKTDSTRSLIAGES